MNAFVKGCDDLRQEYFPGATIVVVHHTGKDVKRRARSSIALLGAADVECSVTKTSHGVIQLENTRQKDDAEQPYDGAVGRCQRKLRRPRSQPGTSGKGRGCRKVSRRSEKNLQTVFWTLVELMKTSNSAITHSQWKAAAARKGVKKSTFDRAILRIIAENEGRQPVKHREDGSYWATEWDDDPWLAELGDDVDVATFG